MNNISVDSNDKRFNLKETQEYNGANCGEDKELLVDQVLKDFPIFPSEIKSKETSQVNIAGDDCNQIVQPKDITIEFLENSDEKVVVLEKSNSFNIVRVMCGYLISALFLHYIRISMYQDYPLIRKIVIYLIGFICNSTSYNISLLWFYSQKEAIHFSYVKIQKIIKNILER